METKRWSDLVEYIINESFQMSLAYGSCNFENFQNITRAHVNHEMHSRSYDFQNLINGFDECEGHHSTPSDKDQAFPSRET